MTIAVPLLRLRTAPLDPRATQLGAAALCTGLLYLALPSSQGELFGIDLRALPVALMLVALAPLAGVDAGWLSARRTGRVALALALLLPAANLAYLAQGLRGTDARQGDARRVLQALPREARVLSIVTENDLSSMLLHAGAFSVLDRGAFYPYLFSADQGYPQAHFRYRDRPYAPSQFWFERGLEVDWEAVRREWPYLLLLGPADRPRIPLPTRVLATSRHATLLEVLPSRLPRATDATDAQAAASSER